ncbi:hypothetical protein EG328_007766 [Venturia inaequalis]|uniref:Large ribosomal subunit protein uL6 alpha-beta domain-containing protein n=1 Tax=Venturia inaequalis TaxID=5025 RepID=A0A8H3ZAE3_VENIN|nr:hypothetical protein EG328_007766 [Venturia inaequalis]
MKYIHSKEELAVPEGVKVHIKSRIVTVTGPRGTLKKDLGHLAVSFSLPSKVLFDVYLRATSDSYKPQNVINIELHHGTRKNVATLRTVRTIINNLFIGRYVYAHFPINVNLEKNADTGLYEVEIRNFIGEKITRKVVMRAGVDVEPAKNVKDELHLSGNSLEDVSQSAADIQQSCRVKNKDIRKFLDGIYVSERGNLVEE